MLKLETNKANINKPSTAVYNFISNTQNLGALLPEQVENFKGDEDMCVFEVKGLAKLGLQILARNPHSSVVFKNTEKTPVKFTLNVEIIPVSDNQCTAQLIFEGDVNPMMKMMIEKPLNNLFSGMASKLEQVMNQL
jgi:carbon monoxide dehydrogenase subunit G